MAIKFKTLLLIYKLKPRVRQEVIISWRNGVLIFMSFWDFRASCEWELSAISGILHIGGKQNMPGQFFLLHMNLKEAGKQEQQVQKLAEKLARCLVETLVSGAVRSWSLSAMRWPGLEEPLGPETVPPKSPGVMAIWLLTLPCLFFFFFTFLSILTISSYHQMGLSPLNPRESSTRPHFLSRTWGLGGKSVSP